MDEFLRDIHTIIFKEWLLQQKFPHYKLSSEDNKVIIETDYGLGEITFNAQSIIEYQVKNKLNDEIEFYLHFQMKNMKHALDLFQELLDSIELLIHRPIKKILLCCSGGMTTSYFASKLNDASQLLYLNYEFEAVGYHQLFNIGDEYHVILLAPQISYNHAQVQEILKDQIVMNIPPQVFAKYDVGNCITLIRDALNIKTEVSSSINHPLTISKNITCLHKILSLAIQRNSGRVHVAYRLYGPQNEIITNNEIIKNKISLQDIRDVIDTLLVQTPDIDMIGVSIPGIINETEITSANVNGLDGFKIRELTDHYSQKIIFGNDVNTVAVGYYASQDQYNSLSALFQPTSFHAGAGMIINGQLITGKASLAGEVQYFPMDLSDDRLNLNKTPEGMIELVSKTILTIMGVIAPEAIVLFCSLIPQVEELKEALKEFVPEEYIPDIIKIDDIIEYSLIGQMILCEQSL